MDITTFIKAKIGGRLFPNTKFCKQTFDLSVVFMRTNHCQLRIERLHMQSKMFFRFMKVLRLGRKMCIEEKEQSTLIINEMLGQKNFHLV